MRSLLFILLIPASLLSQVNEITLTSNWKFRKVGESAWLNATVPGTVHTDLLSNKKIKDPFSPGAEQKLKWIEEADWEYETTFPCDPKTLTKQNAELHFEGLDTYAKVYLNDSLILQANNMFRSWTIEIKRHLRSQNKLKIVFTSAVRQGNELAKKLPYILPESEKVFTRKAQYQYGWDLAPRYVTCGIWKPVKLITWNDARLDNIRTIPYKITDTSAMVNFSFDVHCGKKANYMVVVIPKENKNSKAILNTSIEAGINTYDIDQTVKNPRLWWCHGMGSQELYDFSVELQKDGKIIDSKDVRVGIRKAQLNTSSSLVGSNFYFKLNNASVFMKGANFVPPDVFLPRVKKEDYAKIIQSAVDANMNMLRVWGGGTYADDEFYRLCDEKGIMVWQDLMFACAMYPGDKDFIENSLKEVDEQVTRLISHPSVVLWCGNNENNEGWKNWGWQKQYGYSKQDSAKIWNDYVMLFEKKIPEQIRNAAGNFETNYIFSSPKHGWGHPESMLSGDAHYWGVWWGMEPFEVYNKKVGRFMSEYGFQGMPSLQTLQKYCGENVDSACLKNYEKHPKGFQTINEYMKRDYQMPKTFSNYVYVSQLLQARALQTAIEAHRRHKPYCMGSLYWQLNDCWPGITWSSVDFSGNWKAAHYTAKNCFAEVLVSAVEENDSLKVYVVSDRMKTAEGELDYQLMDLSGKRIWKGQKTITVEANSSKVFFSFPLSELSVLNKNAILLSCEVRGLGGDQLPATLHYFAPPKDLQLAKPKVSMRWLSNDRVEVITDVLAKNVFLYSDDAIHFSDNFFDLLPGEIRIIKLTGDTKKKPEIKIVSLADTY